MHNLYVSPFRLFLFVFLLCFTWYSALSVRRMEDPESQKENVELAVVEEETIPEAIESKPIEPEIVKEEDINPAEVKPSWTNIPIQTNGENRKYGNLVAMQTFFHWTDFSSEEVIEKRVNELLSAGKNAGIFDRKTIVVFPEHIGTGFLFLEEQSKVFKVDSFTGSLQLMALRHKEELLGFPALPTAKRPVLDSILRWKSKRMASAMQNIFSKAAKAYSIPILAGSIILPGPKIVRGELVVDTKQPLYNVSVSFGSDGRIMEPMVKKTVLSEWEELLVEKGDINQNRVWIVPGWKVAVFLGEEVFSEPLYEKLKGRPLDGMVASGFGNPYGKPENLQRYITDSISGMSEKDVWIKHGMIKYIQRTKAMDLIQVFSMGSFLGNSPKVKTFNIRDFQFKDEASSSSPLIMNLYF